MLSAAGAFVWLAVSGRSGGKGKMSDNYVDSANQEVERIFSDEFREELRNRGRLHFEKIISDNAMFLKQDLQLTASDLNKYMQEQIKKVLKEEFTKYEESIDNAKQIAIDAISKTQTALDEQRAALQKQISEEATKEKERLLIAFSDNMSQVVNHYLLEAVGNEIDLSAQLDYIFRHLEDNKQAIIEDIQSGSS
jgi:hypothetical protein